MKRFTRPRSTCERSRHSSRSAAPFAAVLSRIRNASFRGFGFAQLVHHQPTVHTASYAAVGEQTNTVAVPANVPAPQPGVQADGHAFGAPSALNGVLPSP